MPDKAIDIDEDVELLSEQIAALRQLDKRHEPVTEGERYDFSIRWGAALAGRWRRMVHYSTAGRLTDLDECRFKGLRSELHALSDVIDRFRLAQPVFTDAPPTAAKRFRPGRRSRRSESPSRAG
ncbi:hypothetical protein MAAFP003_1341 [Mycobacterium ahvazicum]|uniref:Uncharacterized protein n=1 Tax=Mycobacterium ahvazicum TaxID=1964395 RepID=A0A2K4Y7C5_9MYCO|nr:hypothetical protein MAAFP003_1341 [Mycobacterium ahvazicum]